MAELYRKWAEMDKLILTEGDVIDHAQIKEELQVWVAGESLKEIGFDPWSATQFSLALAEEGLPLVEVRGRSAGIRWPLPSQRSPGNELDDVQRNRKT